MKTFNTVLDQLKGNRSETKFANEVLGITDDTLRSYRKGRFPKGVERLIKYPELLRALAADAEQRQQQSTPNN